MLLAFCFFLQTKRNYNYIHSKKNQVKCRELRYWILSKAYPFQEKSPTLKRVGEWKRIYIYKKKREGGWIARNLKDSWIKIKLKENKVVKKKKGNKIVNTERKLT